MSQEIGKWLIMSGIILILAGIVIYFFHQYFTSFGKLPGDIRIEKENIKIYFPITTMLIVSIVLSLILWVFRKLH